MQAILQQLIDQSRDRDDDWRPSISMLADAWSGLVGERLAEVTRPAGVDWSDGRLTIETTSEQWARELGRRRAVILERLDGVLPWSLRTLEFRAADIAVDSPAAASTATDDAEPEDRIRESERLETSSDVDESLESLPDETADTARRILDHVQSDEGSP